MSLLKTTSELDDSPRTKFLLDFNLAFANGDADFIIKNVSEDIEWIIYGDKHISGKEAFIAEINIMKAYKADELLIHSIINQNNKAALNGEMKMGDKTYAFCDFYLFKDSGSTLIKQLDSYVLPI
ncbi:MAG: nuclear transport factor 2 family protein [Cyclobacteriaceae bacterium]